MSGKSRPILLILFLGQVACAPVSHPAYPRPATNKPPAQGDTGELLQGLKTCGAANGPGCARLHQELAEHYLSAQPLTRTNVDNAGRELQMAAQNPQFAQALKPWRQLLHSWQQQNAQLRSGPPKQPETRITAQLRSAQAEAREAQQKLQRLEQLLHDHAERSLGTPGK